MGREPWKVAKTVTVLTPRLRRRVVAKEPSGWTVTPTLLTMTLAWGWVLPLTLMRGVETTSVSRGWVTVRVKGVGVGRTKVICKNSRSWRPVALVDRTSTMLRPWLRVTWT